MITNGTVEYSRRLRTGDFEHKDAKVSLSFTMADGDDASAVVQRVGEMAVARASEMVGERPALVMPAATVAFVPQPAPAPIVAPPPPPAVDPMAGAVVNGNTVVGAKEPIIIGAAPTIAPAPVASSPVGDASAVALVTDKDLVDAITAKNAKMLAAATNDVERGAVPVKLHSLVGEFVAPPGKVQAISVERRREFLAKLAAL